MNIISVLKMIIIMNICVLELLKDGPTRIHLQKH